jgi:hypothetical protein
VELQARGFQWRPSIVREGTAHGCTVASDDLGFRIAPCCEASFNRPYTADTLLEFFLGMPVRFVDGFCGFLEVMEVAELMRHLGEGMGHSAADGELSVGDHPRNRHPDGLLDLGEQSGEVLEKSRWVPHCLLWGGKRAARRAATISVWPTK